MKNRTKIEWCDFTYNPFVGCSKAGQGCINCYAARQASRGLTPAHAAVASGGNWNGHIALQLRQLKQLHAMERVDDPQKIFIGSMTDLGFVYQAGVLVAESADVAHTMTDLWDAMAASPQHAKILLTKRPEHLRAWIEEEMKRTEMDAPPPWLWVLVSIWDQASADRLIPVLLSTPAAVHGVSAEPLLSLVDLEAVKVRRHAGSIHGKSCLSRDEYAGPRLGWVIVGGENGPGSRRMPPAAARAMRDASVGEGVPFFFKGWGAFNNREWALPDEAKNVMDGRTWVECPPWPAEAA